MSNGKNKVREKTTAALLIAIFMISAFTVICEAKSSLIPIQASSGTEVGGIIEENTTWTLEDSPYLMTETVQIPEGVILTIEPGVTIISRTIGSYFYLSGTIIAYGNKDEKIIFKGNPDVWFSTVTGVRTTEIYLENCIIKGGNWLNYGGFRFFILRNSTLSDIEQPMTLRAYGGNITIKYNSFINTGGIIAGYPSNPIYIKYNLFMNTTYWLIRGQHYTESAKTILKYNSFINFKPQNPENVVGYFSGLDITENYWGTYNTDEIDIMIRDRNDWISIPGYVDYLPILNEPHPDTPQAPPPKPAEFVVSDLSITPLEIEPGEEVEISLLVKNIGEQQGSYMLSVLIENGQIFSWVSVIDLDGGTNEMVRFRFKPEAEGTYKVEVNELIGSFTVKEAKTPASFDVYDLQVHPREPSGGETPEDLSMYPARIEVEGEDDVWTFRVGVNVTNTGELEGNHTVELEINGSIVDSKTLTLAGGEDTRILFEVERGIGTYQVDVDGLKDSFEVVLIHKPSFWDKIPGFPYESIILGLIAVIIIIWRS